VRTNSKKTERRGGSNGEKLRERERRETRDVSKRRVQREREREELTIRKWREEGSLQKKS